jgi:two-component system, NarL family, response regulator LiaR
MATTPIRVIIIDDQFKVHQAITASLELMDDIRVVGQGSSGHDAVLLCEQVNPDIALMDVMMPEMDGIEATRIITERFPAIKVLALSSFQEEAQVRAMMSAGAVGYILKSSSIDDLASTLRATYSGKGLFSPEITQVLLRPPQSTSTDVYALTPRELEVLKLMVQGLNNNEIAAALVVSLATAKFHVSSILTKMEVSSRVEAVALAVQHHLVN